MGKKTRDLHFDPLAIKQNGTAEHFLCLKIASVCIKKSEELLGMKESKLGKTIKTGALCSL